MTEKVKQILKQLTTEEKAEICVGASFWHLYSNNARHPERHGKRRPARTAQTAG